VKIVNFMSYGVTGSPWSIRPVSTARTASAAREETLSLRIAEFSWVLTVLGERHSSRAICRVVCPATSSRTTSTSRGESWLP
jgi:hypothetical protein